MYRGPPDPDLQRDHAVPLRLRRHLGGDVRDDRRRAGRLPEAAPGSRRTACAGSSRSAACCSRWCGRQLPDPALVPFRVHPSIVAIWAIVLTYAVIAAPFVLSGILVALTLTRFPRDVGRLYAFDLVGAALGCVLLVWLLDITDGPTAVLAIAALASDRRRLLRVRRAARRGCCAGARWSACALIVAAARRTPCSSGAASRSCGSSTSRPASRRGRSTSAGTRTRASA